jgi:hypothetical protein
MRRFHLERHEDNTGVSGVGRVAEGVQFRNGWVCMQWLTHTPGLAFYEDMAQVERVHGHQGKTSIVWDDAQ